jgi:peptidoglycan/xylan/chitin deacetylase (PgdA/CDA1 family)
VETFSNFALLNHINSTIMNKFLLMVIPFIMASCSSGQSSKSEKSSQETENTATKLVALSFDDGPNDITTPKVLDILEEFKVPASFFVIGQNINESSAKQMTRAISLGCEIQNHSLTHTFMTQISSEAVADEIEMTDELIEKYTGVRPWLFRPPFIDHNESMHKVIGHTFICGVDCEDWVPERSAKERYETLISQVKDGDIFLLHDFPGNDNTVEALKQLIPELKKQGYTFVTVTELFKKKGIVPSEHNGKIYSNVLE